MRTHNLLKPTHSFIAQQNHRINREGASSRYQGCDDADAEQSENHTAEDDRVFGVA